MVLSMLRTFQNMADTVNLGYKKGPVSRPFLLKGIYLASKASNFSCWFLR